MYSCITLHPLGLSGYTSVLIYIVFMVSSVVVILSAECDTLMVVVIL